LKNSNEIQKVADFLNLYYNEGDNKNKFVQYYTVKHLQWLFNCNSFIFGITAKKQTQKEEKKEKEDKEEEKIGGVMCVRIVDMQLFNLQKNVANVEMIC